jgi:protein-tyrosine phosphatase
VGHFSDNDQRSAGHTDSHGSTHKEFVLRILFVCTRNICRSPTAERLAAAYGARLRIPDLETSSAGIQALLSHPIHATAALILHQLGGDASNFAARQLTAEIASDTDLILAMTRAHRDAVLQLAPQLLHRTFTLNEAARLAKDFGALNVADLADLRSQISADSLLDIADPIGQSAEVFSTIGSQIAELLPPILQLCRANSLRGE